MMRTLRSFALYCKSFDMSSFETGAYNILPMQFIMLRTISLVDNTGELGHALVVVPCIDF